MATARQISEFITEEAGVPSSAINTMTRRLTEVGVVSCGERGKKAPEMSPIDCANLAIGTLALSDNFNTTSNRIVGRVNELANLSFEGKFKVRTKADKSSTITIHEDNSMLECLAALLEQAARNSLTHTFSTLIKAFGITFIGSSQFAWIEVNAGCVVHQSKVKNITFVYPAKKAKRFCTTLPEPRGMKREMSFSGDALLRLAKFASQDNTDWR